MSFGHRIIWYAVVSVIALGDAHGQVSEPASASATNIPSVEQSTDSNDDRIMRASNPKASPPTTSEQLDSIQTIKEAEGDGYRGRPQGLKPGSLLAGTIAVIPGSLVHGLGHFYMGESMTAWTLFAAEVLGIDHIGGVFGWLRQTMRQY